MGTDNKILAVARGNRNNLQVVISTSNDEGPQLIWQDDTNGVWHNPVALPYATGLSFSSAGLARGNADNLQLVLIEKDKGQLYLIWQDNNTGEWRFSGKLNNPKSYAFSHVALAKGNNEYLQGLLIEKDSGRPLYVWQDNEGQWAEPGFLPNEDGLAFSALALSRGAGGYLQAVFLDKYRGYPHLIWQNNNTGVWNDSTKLPNPNGVEFSHLVMAKGNAENLQVVLLEKNSGHPYLIWQDNNNGAWASPGMLPNPAGLRFVALAIASGNAGNLQVVLIEKNSGHPYLIWQYNPNGDWSVPIALPNPDGISYRAVTLGNGNANRLQAILTRKDTGKPYLIWQDNAGYWHYHGCLDRSGRSYEPASWMQDNLQALQSMKLNALCIPGSHDAGMSLLSVGGTVGANACNTITQKHSILSQLNLGVRYFDIRPVISGGTFYTGHYTFVGEKGPFNLKWQGGNGQSIASIIDELNQFTRSQNELIVLYLSHDLNTDVDDSYRPLLQAEYDRLCSELERVDHREMSHANDFKDLTLGHYIGKPGATRPRVLIIAEPSQGGITLKANSGIWGAVTYSITNVYSNTNDLNAMINDQIGKMKSNHDYFLLSWTLTQSPWQAATCVAPVFNWHTPSILDLAEEANSVLSARLLPEISATVYPKIIYLDAIDNSEATRLSVDINYRALGIC
ncbi:MAG: hypothetical protein MI750_03080 [Xanthomonadales bacterium]|nr:hypothetical protein [Xanthomonadales bacterium]